MKILHGTWIPQTKESFIQGGTFYLWVETPQEEKKQQRNSGNIHPHHLLKPDLKAFLTNELGLKTSPDKKLEESISSQYFLLPSLSHRPLPSLELAQYLEQENPEVFEWQYWQIDCYPTIAWVKTGTSSYALVTNVIELLNDLHFLTLKSTAQIQLGADLLFWYHYTQSFKQVILSDRYIPALKYRDCSTAKRKTAKRSQKRNSSSFEIYPSWEIVGEEYETNIQSYGESMPMACLTSSPALKDGDSKNHFLGFLFPRLDLLEGVSPPKQRSMSPEA